MIQIAKAFRSFKFAMKGLLVFVKTENNARIHVVATLLVVFAGFYFHISRQDWLWIVVAVALVFITELMNTATEKLVDFISPKIDPRAGIIKDLAAGAVLIAAVTSVLIGGLIFWPYFAM